MQSHLTPIGFRVKGLNPKPTWVVVKIMVPFWIPIIIRPLICRVPQKGTIILITTHMLLLGPNNMPAEALAVKVLQHAHVGCGFRVCGIQACSLGIQALVLGRVFWEVLLKEPLQEDEPARILKLDTLDPKSDSKPGTLRYTREAAEAR